MCLVRERCEGNHPASGNGHASDSKEDLQDNRSNTKTEVIFIGNSVAEGCEWQIQISRSLYGICEREKSGQEQMNGEPNE